MRPLPKRYAAIGSLLVFLAARLMDHTGAITGSPHPDARIRLHCPWALACYRLQVRNLRTAIGHADDYL